MKARHLLLAVSILFMTFSSAEAQDIDDESFYTFSQHQGAVVDIDLDTSGQFMLSAADSTLILWDFEQHQLLRTIALSDEVSAIAIHPAGELAAVGLANRRIQIWNVKEGLLEQTLIIRYTDTEIAEMPKFKREEIERRRELNRDEYPSAITELKFVSLDRRYSNELVSVHYDHSIKVWKYNAGKKEEVFGRGRDAHTWAITDLCFDNSRYLYTAGADNVIKKWNYSGRRHLVDYEGHTNVVNTIAISADGKSLVSGSRDNTIRLWDISRKQTIAIAPSQEGGVSDVEFSPQDGVKYIASASGKLLSVWKVAIKEGETILQLIGSLEGHDNEITELFFSKNGKYICTASIDSEIKKWDIELLLVKGLFAGQIEKEKEKSGLFKPRGEFEKSEKYARRKAEAMQFEKELYDRYLLKYKAYLKKQEERFAESIEETFETVSLEIDLGFYDADAEHFPVTIEGIRENVPVPIQDAPAFKKAWEKGRVKAKGERGQVDGKIHYRNIKIKDPNTKEEYSFGEPGKLIELARE